MKRKSYRPWAPDQSYLLPPTPRDWLPEGHLAYFILDLMDELDLSALEDVLQAKDPANSHPAVHRPKTETDGTPKPKAQRNFTDPDSRIMRDGTGAFSQTYNAQAAVTDGTQIIVACPLSISRRTPTTWCPCWRRWSKPPEPIQPCSQPTPATENAAWCEQQGIDAYISTRRTRHGPSPPEGEEPEVEPTTAKERMAAKVATEKGRAMYRQRKFIPEPGFGQIKEARGFRRFLLRGMPKVRLEWSLVCTTHNLLKLFRASAGGEPATAGQAQAGLATAAQAVGPAGDPGVGPRARERGVDPGIQEKSRSPAAPRTRAGRPQPFGYCYAVHAASRPSHRASRSRSHPRRTPRRRRRPRSPRPTWLR